MQSCVPQVQGVAPAPTAIRYSSPRGRGNYVIVPVARGCWLFFVAESVGLCLFVVWAYRASFRRRQVVKQLFHADIQGAGYFFQRVQATGANF